MLIDMTKKEIYLESHWTYLLWGWGAKWTLNNSLYHFEQVAQSC